MSEPDGSVPDPAEQKSVDHQVAESPDTTAESVGQLPDTGAVADYDEGVVLPSAPVPGPLPLPDGNDQQDS